MKLIVGFLVLGSFACSGIPGINDRGQSRNLLYYNKVMYITIASTEYEVGVLVLMNLKERSTSIPFPLFHNCMKKMSVLEISKI